MNTATLVLYFTLAGSMQVVLQTVDFLVQKERTT